MNQLREHSAASDRKLANSGLNKYETYFSHLGWILKIDSSAGKVMEIINSFYYFSGILSSACGFCPHVFEMATVLQASHPHPKKKTKGSVNMKSLLFFSYCIFIWEEKLSSSIGFHLIGQNKSHGYLAAREAGYFLLSRLHSRERQEKRWSK